MEEKQEYIGQQVQKHFVFRQAFRYLLRIAMWIGILLALFLLFFQIPSVQNWLVNKVVSSVSEKVETTFELDNAYLSFFDHLVLKDVYIEDYNCDTLLYAKRLDVDFNLNPIVLIRKGLVIEEVGLSDALVNIQRLEGNVQANIDQLLQKLFSPAEETNVSQEQTEKKPFSLGLDVVYLNKVRFRKADEVRGNFLEIILDKGEITVHEMDLPGKLINVEKLEVDGMTLNTDSYDAKPLPRHPIDSFQEQETITPDQTTVDTLTFKLMVSKIDISNSNFNLHNYYKAPVKISHEDELDFKHLELTDIGVQIDSFEMQDMEFKGQISCVSGRSSSGFQLDEFSVKEAFVTPKRTTLNGLRIVTPYSEIGDTLIMRYNEYPDFKEFVDEVRMTAKIKDSYVALKDIMAFAHALQHNTFFQNNRNTVLKIEGVASGKVNSLRARNLDIHLPDGSLLKGNFGSHNLTVKNQEIINLQLTELRTTMRTLKQLLPNFRPPSNFENLGNLHFTGRFDGFFADFVAFGDLRTDIGRAKMDMQMNLLEGADKAKYRGELSLFNFDLGAWSGNPDLGLVNFSSQVENGIGLTSEAATADLQANIESIFFKNYNYQNANLTGKLNQNFFKGDFEIKDENIDFSFVGEIDMNQEIPVFKFKTNVQKLALQPLNLSPQNILLSGIVDLNLRNQKLVDLTGKAMVTDFVISKDGTPYNINSIVAESSTDIEGKKTFILFSEIMGGKVEGDFQIDQLPNVFAKYLAENFSGFADRLNIKAPEKEIDNANFSFDLNIVDSKGLNWLISENLGILKGVRLDGFFNGDEKRTRVNLIAPRIDFGNLNLLETNLVFNGQDSLASIAIEVENTHSKDKPLLPTLNVGADLQSDSLGFKISFASQSPAFFDNLALQGNLYLADSTHYGLTFLQRNLMIFESPWMINPQNKILFNKEELAIEHFEMISGDKYVNLTNVGPKGAKLLVNNLEFSYIDEIWDYDQLDFSGKYDLNVNIQDVFKLKNISMWVRSGAFYINDDHYGKLELDAFAKSLKGRANAHMDIYKGNSRLKVDGFYNIGAASNSQKLPENQKAKYVDFKLEVENYPLDFASYFVAPEVKDIEGSFDVNFGLKGMFPKPDITGQVIATNGAFTIDYLNTRYAFDRSVVEAGTHLFDATGTVITDKFGNTATIEGGISHNYLKDLGVAATLKTDKFLALDTKKQDNSLYYGVAMGKGEVRFNGRFQAVDIYVNAEVDDETNIVVPVSYDREATELNSIRFVNKHAQVEEVSGFLTQESPSGISFEMDLSVKENAIMELIFNEQLGDIIRGQGRGNIKIEVPRGEDFRMFGNYVIERGNYLFTFWNVINKDFNVKQGGTINWDGDPFAAQINLEAEYKDLTVSPINFIKEYVTPGTDLEAEAYNRTDVELTLMLKGELLKPDINFDINFPSLTSQLQTFANNKLRLLKADQNELNRQVFGLIVIGQFFPSDFSSGNVLGNTAGNTLSEFLSNQFSLLVTNLFSEASEENKIFSNTKFDFVYKSQSQEVTLPNQTSETTANQDIELSITKKFFNDRLSIQVGGNVGIGNNVYGVPEDNGAFIGDDIVIEYILNKNRTLKLKIYQKLEPDISGGRRFQVGTGLSYRREFDSFSEFFKSFKKARDKADF